MTRNKHTTWYEDGGFVGVRCDGEEVNSLAVGEPPEPCARCGTLLTVAWHVRIIEHPSTPTEQHPSTRREG